ncbi:MAG: response regulator, partial [Planctomycetota bacterium]
IRADQWATLPTPGYSSSNPDLGHRIGRDLSLSNPNASSPAPNLSADALQWRDYDASDFRILIADDLEDTRFVLRRALSREGFQIDEATNGEELLEIARRQPPDLMIIDIMMPRLDGLSALAEIRQDPDLAHAYIILLTGKSSVNEKIEGFQLGADDYVTKPYSLGELKARVNAGIRLKSLHRNLAESQQIIVRQEKLATIGVLAAGIAHEFNNIMSGISGYAQLAKNSSKFVDRLIGVALEQSERAQKITSSLATFAGSASNAATLNRPRELVDSSVCLLQKELRRQIIEFEVDVPEDLPAVRVNSGQMQQALVHLILNAIQAVMPEDTEETEVDPSAPPSRISVRARADGNRVQIEVDDSGRGIPEDLRHRVFDPFFTTKGALGNSAEPGTGLGLTFALNTVSGHQGTIDVVDSELGGACVRLELPQAEIVDPAADSARLLPATSAPETDQRASSEEPPGGGLHGLPKRVVLAEDDEAIQEVVTELLEDHAPVIFESGADVVEHCRTERVDTVILDLTLKGSLTGWDVLAELAQLDDPPAVVLTSGSLSLKAPIDLDYPDLRILPKPFRLVELERALLGVASPTA